MNKSLRLFTAAAALAAAAALFYTCARQIQKQRFIDARFTTAHMRTVQSETGLPLDLNELIGRPVPDTAQNGWFLYSALYYPGADTVVCTVSMPFSDASARLIHSDGTEAAGWYMPQAEQFGIQKIFFEECGFPDFAWLAIEGSSGSTWFLIDREFAYPDEAD